MRVTKNLSLLFLNCIYLSISPLVSFMNSAMAGSRPSSPGLRADVSMGSASKLHIHPVQRQLAQVVTAVYPVTGGDSLYLLGLRVDALVDTPPSGRGARGEGTHPSRQPSNQINWDLSPIERHPGLRRRPATAPASSSHTWKLGILHQRLILSWQ